MHFPLVFKFLLSDYTKLSIILFLSEHRQSVRGLSELRIWYEQPLPGGMQGWLLNNTFKSNMKTALLGG